MLSLPLFGGKFRSNVAICHRIADYFVVSWFFFAILMYATYYIPF